MEVIVLEAYIFAKKGLQPGIFPVKWREILEHLSAASEVKL